MSLLSHFFSENRHLKNFAHTKRSTLSVGLFLFSLTLLLSLTCSENKSPTKNESKGDPDIVIDDDPVVTGFIRNLGVSFAAWNRTTNRAGAFVFTIGERKVFREFGDPLQPSGRLPCFEYRLPKEATVLAMANGIIERAGLHPNGTDDEIAMVCTADGQWELIYSHLTQVRVAAGDTVKAGDVLGNPGVWSASLGRVAVQLKNFTTGLAYCPVPHFASDVAAGLRSALTQHMLDWETFKGNNALYDENQMQPACCSESLASVYTEDKPKFAIYNLGVTFAPFNPTTKRVGDFIFKSSYGKVFYEFAAVVNAGGGKTKELPTFEYRVRKEAAVFALTDGVVLFKTYQQDTQDYELLVQSTYDADWAVCYDHVKNPRFAVNDFVATGDTLGSPGTWDANLGRFEISVNNIKTQTSYCPFCYFDEATSAIYQAKVAQHMSEIEAFLGNSSLYDEAAYIYPGCRKESMKN